MPIEKVGTDTTGTGTGLSVSFNHTLTSGTNRLVVVYICTENGNTIDVSTVSYGGVTMAKAIDDISGTSGFRNLVEIWYILEASLPADGSRSVAITLTGTASSLVTYAYCAEYIGVMQGTPEATNGVHQTSGATITNAISPSTGAWVFSAMGSGNINGSWVQNQGQTELWDHPGSGTGQTTAGAELRGASGETSLSSTYTGTVNRLVRVAASWVATTGGEPVEFTAASTAGSAAPDDGMLAVSRTVTGTVAGVSAAPDEAGLSLDFYLSAVSTAATTTPSVALALAKAVVGNITGEAFAANASLDISKALSVIISLASTAQDDAVLAVKRDIAGAAGISAWTPDDPALALAIDFLAALMPGSATPDDVIFDVAIVAALAAAISAASGTPDTLALAVTRTFAGVLAGQTATPDDTELAISKLLSAIAAADSVTSDDTALAIFGLVEFLAATAAQSAASDGAALTVTGLVELAATLVTQSAGIDVSVLEVLRSLAGIGHAQSTAPDDVALNTTADLVELMATMTVQPAVSGAALGIARALEGEKMQKFAGKLANKIGRDEASAALAAALVFADLKWPVAIEQADDSMIENAVGSEYLEEVRKIFPHAQQ